MTLASNNGLNFDELVRILPIKQPFILIDRVLELKPNDYIRAVKCVSGCDPILEAHFKDGAKLLPGVYLIEAVNQCAYILGVNSEMIRKNDVWVLVESVASFRASARPGDLLNFDVSFESIASRHIAYKGIVRRGDDMLAKITCTAMLPQE